MSKNNLIKDLVNLSNSCLDYDYEAFDEIIKHRKSYHSFTKIKECFKHEDRNKQKDCVINSLMTQVCTRETIEMTECTKNFGNLIKKEGKCVKEINALMNCLESELSYMNMVMYT